RRPHGGADGSGAAARGRRRALRAARARRPGRLWVSPAPRALALLTLLRVLRARSERRLQGATQPADPVGRPIDVRPLCASPVEPPGAVIAGVEPVRRTSGLDLRSLVPLVVARDGDE